MDDPKELSYIACKCHSSPLSLNGDLDSDKRRPATTGNDSNNARSLTAKSSIPGKVHILEPQGHPNRECDLEDITTPLQRGHTRLLSGHGVGARPSLNSHPHNATPGVNQTRSIDNEERASSKRVESFTLLRNI